MNSMKDLLILMEGKKSRHQQILECYEDDEYKKIYLEWYSIGSVLTEAQVTQDQIKQIFAAIDAGAKAGKNVDAPGTTTPAGTVPKKGIMGSINNAWLNFKDKIAQSDRVNGFDLKFDKLQQQLLGAVGGKTGVIGKTLDAYKKFATKYPKTQGAIYAALSILVGMSGWGMGAPAILLGMRTLDRLLQGDRLTSALWQGFKTGALSYAAGEVSNYLKGSPAPDTSGYPSGGDPYHGGDMIPNTGMTDYVVKPNEVVSKIAEKFHISSEELLKANPDITNANDLAAGQHIKIPSPTGNPVYHHGVGTAADTAAKVASGQYTPSRYGIKESILDESRMQRTWAIQESMNLPQLSTPYVTQAGIALIFSACERQHMINEGLMDTIKNAAGKVADKVLGKNTISADKLDLFWRRNYGEYSQENSVDVKVVVDFLRRMGVKDGLINQVFSELKIPMNDVTPDTKTDTPVPAEDGSLTPEQMIALINPMTDQLNQLWEKLTANQGNKIGDFKVRDALANLAKAAIKMSNSTGSTNPIKMTNVPGTFAESKKRRI